MGAPTLIEKLERESPNPGFANVLLVGEVEGREAGSGLALQPRARQNAMAELGYFIAKLGRRRVMVLYEPGVDIPSDFSGVAHTAIASGGAWRLYVEQEVGLSRIL